MYSNLRFASVLGGKIHGDSIIAPAPGHGSDDMSLLIVPNKDRTDYIVTSQRNDDPAACRVYIDEQMKLARQRTEDRKSHDEQRRKMNGANGANHADRDWIDKTLAAPADDAEIIDPGTGEVTPAGTTPPPLVPNLHDINRHLYELFPPAFASGYPDAGIEIAWGNPAYKDGAVNQCKIFSVFDLEKAAAFAFKKNEAGNNVYIAPGMRIGSHKEGRAKKEHVLTARFGWAEYDGAGDADRIAQICKDNRLWPAMSVVTGTVPNRREQLYFELDGVPTPADLDAIGAGLMKLLGTDCVFNCDRVMRLGGTVNWPTADKIGRGYTQELTRLRLVPEASKYSIEHLSGLGAAAHDGDDNPFTRAGEFAGNYKEGRTDDDIMELLEATRIARNWHNAMRDAIASMLGYDWSNLQIKLACAPYCRKGFGDEDLDGFIDEARIKWDKPDPDAERRQEHQQAKQKGPRVSIVATPYAWTDAKDIPLRDWLYGRLLVRQFLSMTIAPGGVGKSSLIVAEALSMVTARDLVGIKARPTAQGMAVESRRPADRDDAKDSGCVHSLQNQARGNRGRPVRKLRP
jgi:hypothetical protein